MRASFALVVAATFAAIAIAAPAPAPAEVEERALPVGHPILDDSFLSIYSGKFTLKTNMYPDGFAIPTETLTGIPHGYSIGPTAVWGPDGKTVSAYPSDAIAQVAVKGSQESNPGAPPAPTQATGTPAQQGSATQVIFAGKSALLAGAIAAFVGLVL